MAYPTPSLPRASAAKPRASRPLRPRPAGMVLACLLLGTAGRAQPVEFVAPPATVLPKAQAGDSYWWSDRFDLVRLTNQATTHYFLKSPVPNVSFVFYPPMPPPLGAEIPLLGSLLPNGPSAPPALAPQVNDLFYPLLASRLAEGPLPPALQLQLETYQAEKAALQTELRTRLAELKDTPAETRQAELAALASRQAARLDALEIAAERLYAELQPRSLFGLKQVEVLPASDDPGTTSPLAILFREAALLRHAAFFQDGLGPTQRRLLREEAHELILNSRTATATTGEAPVRWLYFSPETSRIRVPETLPAALERSLADYTTLKQGLKNELAGVVRRRELKPEARAAMLRELAADQAPRLATLEALAEDLRRAFATLPDAGGAPAPNLPPELATRISHYRRHKVELLKTLHAMLADSPKSPAAGGSRPPPKDSTGKPLGLRESVAEFSRRQSALLADLNKETAEIRQALAEYARTTGRPGDRKSIDDLLRDFESARQRQEILARYRDYQAAVLQPGLSPAQRRLLFDAAVTQLALPLPAGEIVR